MRPTFSVSLVATQNENGERDPRMEAALGTLRRQTGALDHLQALAHAATDPVAEAQAWIAVKAQAARYRHDLEPWRRAKRMEALAGDLAAQEGLLDQRLVEAGAALDATDAATVADAQRRQGIRVAIVGKGGAGKSMISATVSRLLGRRGRPVLAVDLDTSHGMGYSLGVGTTDAALPPEALEEHGGSAYGWQLASGLPAHLAVERHAIDAPDGVRFLSLGKIEDLEKQSARRSVAAVRQVLAGFAEPGWDMIGDMEAGPTTAFERYHSFADLVVVVVGPAWRSALTARRLLPIVAGIPTIIVANRFRDEPDHEGLEPVLRVPYDADTARAEHRGLAPIDECPGSPAMVAVGELVELLLGHTNAASNPSPTNQEVAS